MVDSLSQLEERVEVLIHHLERTLRANEELHQRNAQLESEAERLQDEAGTLTQRARDLETQLQETAGKEEVIRDRLQGILEKIDSIEHEMVESGAAEQ